MTHRETDNVPDSNNFNRPWSRFRLVYGCFLILTMALYTYGFVFDSNSGFRVGTVFLVVTLLYVPLFLVKKDDRIAALEKAKRLTAGILVFVGIFILGGEITLRVIYWDGYSFGSHSGPLVKRFERNFRYNQYDGPSRGPEIGGTTKLDTLRVLAQGDSITWGQGLRSEEKLFSTLLLAAIRGSGRPAEMAVLAPPGREIDGHLEQLQKWRQEIDPDVIIYQWYVNDIELDKSSRPTRAHRPWQIRYVHQFLAASSYLYYFLDYHFGRMLPSSAQKYEEYIAENYAKVLREVCTADGTPRKMKKMSKSLAQPDGTSVPFAWRRTWRPAIIEHLAISSAQTKLCTRRI